MSSPESATLEKVKLTIPGMWTVILHNDDFTPMDFVVMVLTSVFHLDEPSAAEIMLKVHNEGRAPVGKFTKEIAVSKATQVVQMAEQMQHPLQATPEKV
jgi:ATP-dependent Clp protease adaptor protein ClpS